MSKIVGVEERRRHPRVKFESLVRVAGNGRKGRKAVGRDISFGGCSFYVDKSANWAKNEWIEIAVLEPAVLWNWVCFWPSRTRPPMVVSMSWSI